MRKIALLLAVVLVLSAPLSAQAAMPRTEIIPTLSFSGTTARCEVIVDADHTYDYVVVMLKLFHGNNLIAQWSEANAGSVDISETCTVTKGVTYTLTAQVTINGYSYPSCSTTKTC